MTIYGIVTATNTAADVTVDEVMTVTTADVLEACDAVGELQLARCLASTTGTSTTYLFNGFGWGFTET